MNIKPLTEDQIFELGDLAAKGWNIRDISNRLGYSTMKIRDEMLANGIKTKHMGKCKPVRETVVQTGFFSWSAYGEEGYLMFIGLPRH